MSGWECKLLTRPRCGRMRSQPGNTLSLAAAAKVKGVTWALRLKAREGGDCLGCILVRATYALEIHAVQMSVREY